MKVNATYRALVGQRVREARSFRGWSTRDLARHVGVSAATISAIENGHTAVTVERLASLAAALQVSMPSLLQSSPTTSTAGAAADASWRSFAPLTIDPVLTAATREFVKVGYHGATMRAIAIRARMSMSSVYHYYPSKQALLITIFDLTMDDLEWRLAEATRGIGAPLPRISRLVEALSLYHMLRAELAFIGASEMRSLETPERERIAQRRRAVQHLIDNEIDRAVATGEAGTHMPLETGRAIVTICTSLPQWFDVNGPTTAEVIAAEYAGLALRMIVAHTQ